MAGLADPEFVGFADLRQVEKEADVVKEDVVVPGTAAYSGSGAWQTPRAGFRLHCLSSCS